MLCRRGIFFQNILLNSELAGNVVEDSLIFDIWGERGLPAYLELTDYTDIQASQKPFARKVSPDSELYRMLKEKVY